MEDELTKYRNWAEFLQDESKKDYMRDLSARLEQAYSSKTVYPARENLFSALESTPLDAVKVVILGQDPYHQPGQAQGFAFSVPENMKIPPSLKNIYKELEAEYSCRISRSGDLQDWAHSGVLLLNTILSVEQGRPLSHADFGWQAFTNRILDLLNVQKQPIVFLLWGRQAARAGAGLNNPDHLIIETSHPSPLSAHRSFLGSGQFKAANDFLESRGVSGIDWTASNKSSLR